MLTLHAAPIGTPASTSTPPGPPWVDISAAIQRGTRA